MLKNLHDSRDTEKSNTDKVAPEKAITGIWAIIPIKARDLCKTRLSQHLSDEQRLGLVRSMLQHVIHVLEANTRIEKVLVLSSERDDVPEHIEVLADKGIELNSCLQAAVQQLQHHHAVKQLLIVPADLAALTLADTNALLDAATATTIAIAPSEDRQGTNALCLPVDSGFEFAFGDKSFLRHCTVCSQLGYDFQVVASHGLGFDLDTGDDFAHYERRAKHDQNTAAAINNGTLA